MPVRTTLGSSPVVKPCGGRVEVKGLEPSAYGLQSRRSSS